MDSIFALLWNMLKYEICSGFHMEYLVKDCCKCCSYIWQKAWCHHYPKNAVLLYRFSSLNLSTYTSIALVKRLKILHIIGTCMSNISFCNIGNSKVLKNIEFYYLDYKVIDQLMLFKRNQIPWCNTTGNRAAPVSFLPPFGYCISFMKTKSRFIIW